MGATPTIDGIFQDGEWADANTIVLDSTKTIHLKHDKENLYIALDGDGGNIYVLKDDLITILHASFSLGWAEYSKRNGTSWDCQREYNWELYKLQEKTEAEISGGMN
ncbi:MAG: hypothetical protein KJ927_06135, partial [Candidatus Eisenbacteria bacterium]|nr:hypothetical protein [Candidatus Eisenbacteria bacterium]